MGGLARMAGRDAASSADDRAGPKGLRPSRCGARAEKSRWPLARGAASADLAVRQRAAGIGPARSETELRLVTSMAVLRMVNGIVDQEQKGEYARSVSGIALKKRLPRVLVDAPRGDPQQPALARAADHGRGLASSGCTSTTEGAVEQGPGHAFAERRGCGPAAVPSSSAALESGKRGVGARRRPSEGRRSS